jgi:hypothetical protein
VPWLNNNCKQKSFSTTQVLDLHNACIASEVPVHQLVLQHATVGHKDNKVAAVSVQGVTRHLSQLTA